MNKQTANRIGAALFALTLAFSVHAQTTKTLHANIPFEFTVGKTTLPPGDYSVQVVPGSPTVTLLGAETRAVTLTLPEQIAPVEERTTLTFNQFGGQYFLAQVRTASWVRSLPSSKLELELQRKAAISPRKEIVIAMR